MSTELVALPPDATFAEAAEVMAEHRVHHLLVRDGDRLAGMVHLDVEWSQLSGAVWPPTASFAAPIEHQRLRDELLVFPHARYDNQIDTVAYAALELANLSVKTIARRTEAI